MAAAAREACVPVLTEQQVLAQMDAALPPSSEGWLSFYSTVLGGIVTDPRFFSVPVDDHFVHRGHAVFDTCNVKAGKAFGVNFHLDRLLRSAELAKISHPFVKDQLAAIILHTIAATHRQDGVRVRYWLSAGRGDFWITPDQCTGANFYVVVHEYKEKAQEGVQEWIVGVPLKPPLLATMKSTNYLLNALAAMESKAQGGYLGIQTGPNGYVAESSIANVALVDVGGVLRTPKFERILAGTTVKRAFWVAPKLVQAGLLEGFEFSDIHVSEFDTATEVLLLGGGGVVPVTQVNGRPIGEGRPGPIYKAIAKLLDEDMLESEEHLHDIPYSLYKKPARRVATGEAGLPVAPSAQRRKSRGPWVGLEQQVMYLAAASVLVACAVAASRAFR